MKEAKKIFPEENENSVFCPVGKTKVYKKPAKETYTQGNIFSGDYLLFTERRKTFD